MGADRDEQRLTADLYNSLSDDYTLALTSYQSNNRITISAFQTAVREVWRRRDQQRQRRETPVALPAVVPHRVSPAPPAQPERRDDNKNNRRGMQLAIVAITSCVFKFACNLTICIHICCARALKKSCLVMGESHLCMSSGSISTSRTQRTI